MSDRPDIDAYLRSATAETRKNVALSDLFSLCGSIVSLADEIDVSGEEPNSLSVAVPLGLLRGLRAALAGAREATQ